MNNFQMTHSNGKNIYLTVFKSTNDIKLRNFQYKYIMRIVPTNQFLQNAILLVQPSANFAVWR